MVDRLTAAARSGGAARAGDQATRLAALDAEVAALDRADPAEAAAG